MVPPLVLWSPLNFFWPILKISNFVSTCFKTIRKVFFHEKNYFERMETSFGKFFSNGPPFGHPLYFFRPVLKISHFVSTCFKTIRNVFFHKKNYFERIENKFRKIFFPMVPFGPMVTPLYFFPASFENF